MNGPNKSTNLLQKKFIAATFAVFFLIIGAALLIRSGGDLYLQSAFFHLFARYDFSGAVLLILILVAGIVMSPKMSALSVNRSLALLGNNPVKISAGVLILLVFGAVFVYHRHPLCMDEYMPYFQARIFAEGKLWGEFPPDLVPWLLKKQFFSVFSFKTGHVISEYWPGFALLLTPLMKLGVPWLLNPLISAGTILLFAYYTRKVLPGTNAVAWGLLLTISSASFMVNGISFYSMNAHMFLNLLYAVLLLDISPLRLFLAGLVGSLALVLHNPLPHFLFAVPWILWLAFRQNRCRNIAILFAGYLPMTILAGFGWIWLKMFITAPDKQTAYSDAKIVSQASKNFMAIVATAFRFPDMEILWGRFLGLLKLFAWSVPGLPLLAYFGLRYIRGNPYLKLWAWSAACTLIAFLFVPFNQGHGWGFRYFQSAWLALPLLAAAFLTSISWHSGMWKKLVFLLAALSLMAMGGLRFYQVHQFIDQHLSQLPGIEEPGRYICIVDTSQGYYTNDLVQNDPFLRNPVIVFRKKNNTEDHEVISRNFPGARLVSRTGAATIWQLPKHVEILTGSVGSEESENMKINAHDGSAYTIQ